jgi:hypothetical protein
MSADHIAVPAGAWHATDFVFAMTCVAGGSHLFSI